ncbi:MAG TPA: helix-turn-helix transcriptional regulator [Terriglobia bacterium]|nr:helix-turn-helix transcriptional regulator [Terriglobia bacterium]
MIIGTRIRQLREERGITRDEIEEFSGLDHSYIARIEQGLTMPPLETLERIAFALAVPLYWLFCAEEDPDPLPAPPVVTAHQHPWDTRPVESESQFLRVLGEASDALFEADPASLLEFARRTALGKLEN